jgi:hypothetical protein
MDQAARDLPEDTSELLMPVDEAPDVLQPGPRGGLMHRLVARAVPPNLIDREQEHIAEEAAENAIRRVAWMAGIAAAILLVVTGALLLYAFANSRAAAQAQASRITAVEWENAKLREANTALQQQLEQATKDQTRLRGEAAAWQAQVASLAEQLQQARALAAQRRQKAQASQPIKGRSRVPTVAIPSLRPQPVTPHRP